MNVAKSMPAAWNRTKRIILTLRAGAWWAEWEGPEAERLAKLMGSAEMATPFLWPGFSFDQVVAELRPLNPGYEFALRLIGGGQ